LLTTAAVLIDSGQIKGDSMHFKLDQNKDIMNMDARLQGGGYQRTREMTLDDMLLENRIVFMIGEINYRMATEVIMKLLYLDNLKKGIDISLYINSPGGSVDDTMAIYDTMRFINSPVSTYCIGRAQSGGAIVLAAGAKGKRHALPHAKVMLHQPWGGITGQASDIRIQADEINKSKRIINEILAKHTGMDIEKIAAETERDKYLTAQEALEYGLIDEVLVEPEEQEAKAKAEDKK
jgi:ATP-dependent Clp protease protease subunit